MRAWQSRGTDLQDIDKSHDCVIHGDSMGLRPKDA
jgi:hypothetical protein